MPNRTCTIDRCERFARALGLCGRHYTAARKHGDPLANYRPLMTPGRFGITQCRVLGCPLPGERRGLCQSHAWRERRGRPMTPSRPPGWASWWLQCVVASSAGQRECIDWPGHVVAGGYGRLFWRGRKTLATEVVLELLGQPRPAGLVALHSCDRPLCVNPAHLSWGTQQQNVADMYARGRR